MIIGDRIKFIRNKIGLSRSDFEPDISASTLRHWETGAYSPKESNLSYLLDIFKSHGANVNTAWLKSGKGPEPKLNGIALLEPSNKNSSISNDKYTSLDERNIFIKDEILFRDVNRIKDLYPDCDTFLICSSEMSPRFKIGDYVFGSEINIEKYRFIDLEPAIISLKNGRKKLCYFSYSKDCEKVSFLYDHGLINFKNEDVLKISIVFFHRRSAHLF